MYKISVPVMNMSLQRNGRETTLRELRRLDAERVLLALKCYELDPARRKAELDALADNVAFFKANGLEVGAWIWTFWFQGNHPFQSMRSIDGTDIHEFACPYDKNFLEFATAYITDIATCGVDLIQFDDDYRYGFLSDSPACLCDLHIAEIHRITGKQLSREEIARHIVGGAKNDIRDAYLTANGNAMRAFAVAMRRAVDRVDPHIRLGACACMSSWDIDGTHARELAYLLAGDTQPFVRLIGAPYWAPKCNWGNHLQDVIELERMESTWTKDGHVELLAEGDAFPRPRSSCPASYLEGFDTAIRASGCTDGILKYGIDYYSNADYETGYADFHVRNRELYQTIDRTFRNKVGCGVRVYESMRKVANMVVPTAVNTNVNIEDLFFSKAARTLAYNSIPTVYEGDGICGIVFDENARDLPLSALKNGLILDIAAAEILTARGVDVGLKRIGAEVNGDVECFLNDRNHIFADHAIGYETELDPNAQVMSVLQSADREIPCSYRYENADGNRFLVLNLNTRFGSDHLLKHYARSRQYIETIPWLGGQPLPASVYGHPALYQQCKRDADSLSVGLWNFFADPVISPVIHLSQAYAAVSGIHCTATLNGTEVTLTDIPAFGFAGFEVTNPQR